MSISSTRNSSQTHSPYLHETLNPGSISEDTKNENIELETLSEESIFPRQSEQLAKVSETNTLIKQLIAEIGQNSSLSPSQKEDLYQKITVLKSQLIQLQHAGKKMITQDISEKVSELERFVHGNINFDDFGMVENDNDSNNLEAELKQEKARIQFSKKLPSELKANYIRQIDKMLSNLLNPAAQEKIGEDFESLKTEVVDAEMYPAAVTRLAQKLEMEPSRVSELMKKHGLDPENLPSPPDAKMAAFLSDSEINVNIGSLQFEIESSSRVLKEEITKQTRLANEMNNTNINSDTSKADNSDVSSYKFLYDASLHKDEKSLQLIEARKNLAGQMADLLGAIYGKTVKACQEPEKAGMIQFDGTTLNTLSNGASPNIQFSSSTPIEWPSVQLVTFEVDAEGDGQTSTPQWMLDGHYPLHAYESPDDGTFRVNAGTVIGVIVGVTVGTLLGGPLGSIAGIALGSAKGIILGTAAASGVALGITAGSAAIGTGLGYAGTRIQDAIEN